MIVLDTNVVSEVMRPQPHPAVLAWLDDQAAETLYISSVTLAEVLFGIEVMAAGRRKNALAEAFAGIRAVFEQRVLPFDAQAARQYAGLAPKARAAGKGFPIPDGYIAAIAAAKGFRVASRDVSAFHAAGIPVVNPWESAT
ncbi:type II toxin-antitoxin system VapC family toxin [Mesorhizobium sp. M4B.F.Ca.ET.215.01.1.1]|uniref:type II toxin-antitoxin system VapC family toxin n=1 Tax=unclassified Mesorhizobium TaxID=325217 RepID=UPI000FCBA9E1|nr:MULTISPECIES: type II toxin-antitoxin system VapC family toxin [unclassified Mesorhizobium]RVC61557.1 type II toxin-antitoxin system VapC family toxin [Mesorhizobium sp. M4B.F.Ca.ET.088.02.2.1]RUW23838.1 type II toxin-antitoxin system VapC family toxin [Mesorhizobium sp. M4B.F.Ca.ET.013.02.1.1]RVD44190.1 type II toxin-antitoxin system VapC family toxin [Mesorhizobium sp. M4B.F.Ca.ET.019.03.1.1]RWF31115.1 MAG: type II toxin-antitoxin system VapC family toxin [Mesorhizobium sp.]RWF40956.1 MAG